MFLDLNRFVSEYLEYSLFGSWGLFICILMDFFGSEDRNVFVINVFRENLFNKFCSYVKDIKVFFDNV